MRRQTVNENIFKRHARNPDSDLDDETMSELFGALNRIKNEPKDQLGASMALPKSIHQDKQLEKQSDTSPKKI